MKSDTDKIPITSYDKIVGKVIYLNVILETPLCEAAGSWQCVWSG